MTENLNLDSSREEIGWSLRETLDKIKDEGETPQLKFDMLLKYGRVLFMEENYEQAYEVFQQCSIHGIDNGVKDLKDLYFWTSRCLQEKGDTVRAKNSFLMLLEREPYNNNEETVNAILDRLDVYDDLAEVIVKYKKKKQDDWDNPPDLLSATIKFLKEREK